MRDAPGMTTELLTRRLREVQTIRSRSPGAKVVKIRWVKPYEGAQNHICIGEVLEESPNYLKVFGKTFHFRKPQGHAKAVQYSSPKTRWIPWSRIEVVTELPEGIDWRNIRFTVDAQNRLCVAGDSPHSDLISD